MVNIIIDVLVSSSRRVHAIPILCVVPISFQGFQRLTNRCSSTLMLLFGQKVKEGIFKTKRKYSTYKIQNRKMVFIHILSYVHAAR